MSATMLLLNLIGAVALLLWGMRMVRTGAQRAFGARLRHFMQRWLTNRFAAFGAGLGVTGLLQSSTAACLMTADFAAQGVVALSVALAIMLGADVGTSLVAQVFSFDFSWASPLLILVGFATFSSSPKKRRRSIGRIFLGLGLMLLSLKLIVASSAPLRSSDTMLVVIRALEGEPLLAVLIAGVLTWLAHSSLATVLLVASLAASGSISEQLALTLVIGANLGGALPPIMATLHGARAGRCVAIGNALFKVVGAMIVLSSLGVIMPYLAMLDPDPVRMSVNLHTAFNIGLAVIFLPLITFSAQIVERLVPEETLPEEERMLERNLGYHEDMDPDIALTNATREVLRMGDLVDDMLERTMTSLREGGDPTDIAAIGQRDDMIDQLYEAVKLYLTEMRREALDDDESRRCGDVMSFCTNLEHIGDIIENIVDAAVKKQKKMLHFSAEGQEELDQLYSRLHDNLRLALGVFISGDLPMARKLLREKVAFRALEQQAAENHYKRLEEGRPETIETSAMHLDVIRDLKRVNSHLASVAYPILEQAGELRTSRLRAEKSGAQSPAGGAWSGREVHSSS
ncbi:Na/Pi cotransporter family protein [Aestuariispira ectoiniformans]|uniref:Na/Pi cotransporter family protein n=1 Tax=Aestuariispira ectoiniformans TaxID=2775080 RepID=UPI00223AC552|nr:Na/Pi cotransporter family protein [Aestuariispira ectoiniformans]